MYKSKYFKPEEFSCHCGCGLSEVSDVLLEELDSVREHFGVPISITSGRRCDAHNRAVGGAPKSQHKDGTAADIKVKGVPPTVVYKYLNNRYAKKYGVGLYSTFVHFDVRPQKARW
ncbi:D-Ala-D-Ala carboxypeptidase family metallohydrolase [Sphingobium sp. CFD-1]|uniref:D-Ala-D-Ala carboxypeptidase family metallohydrolase n=1 Tax=Sphingobium sp. CFD-1 TaxID=2878545 RepID=UPI00214B1880|nr:D-Ala-D-Ala carboxypeptidase family metallohydrolase [Sphingobium sp. CFD-1]